jgi:hypothetical protein
MYGPVPVVRLRLGRSQRAQQAGKLRRVGVAWRNL